MGTLDGVRHHLVYEAEKGLGNGGRYNTVPG
jgi:hypothetical protein